MSTASALLAIRSVLFVVSALLHGARALLDLLPRRRRVVSRASTFWASVGLVFFAAAFALGYYRDRSSHAGVAAGFVAPAALWAFKVSVVSLYPQLGLRLLVVGALGGYLAASFLSALLMRLFVCRPWADWDKEYCGLTAAVVAYSVLNVSSYILGKDRKKNKKHMREKQNKKKPRKKNRTYYSNVADGSFLFAAPPLSVL